MNIEIPDSGCRGRFPGSPGSGLPPDAIGIEVMGGDRF